MVTVYLTGRPGVAALRRGPRPRAAGRYGQQADAVARGQGDLRAGRAELVGAQSTGHVRLRSGDPKDKPAITANYLKEHEDMQAMIGAVERGREIFASAPLRSLVGREIHPGGDTSSRQALDKIIRSEVEHTYHPACTARIGTESSGVVDPQLRVHGVQVADASVFPSIPHGNTHGPDGDDRRKAAIMIAASGCAYGTLIWSRGRGSGG